MVEIVRMVADWLAGDQLDVNGADQSVAVHLAAMTFDGTDTAPTAPTILDETRDGNTARGDQPEDSQLPALQVVLEEYSLLGASVSAGDQRGTAMVVIRYCAASATSESATRDGMYVMRAVRRSLERLHRAGEETNGLRRNEVVIYPSATQLMRLAKVEAQKDDTDLTAAWFVPYDVWELDV